MGIEPYLAASALRGVVAQRLVRKLCPACRKEYIVDETVWEWKLFQNMTDAGNTNNEQEKRNAFTLYRHSGCEACRRSGYRGRVAVHEILPVNTALKKKIICHASEQDLWDSAITEYPGLASLEEDGKKKVKEGVTSVQELLSVLGV